MREWVRGVEQRRDFVYVFFDFVVFGAELGRAHNCKVKWVKCL